MKRLLELGDVVVTEDEGVLAGAFRDAGRIGGAEGCACAAGGDEKAVDVAVIVSGELDDLVATGIAPRGADGAHRSFSAGIDEADFLDRGDAADDEFGEMGFGDGGRAETRSAIDCCVNCRADFGMGVAQDHRSPGTDVIEVAIAIKVVEVGALTALKEDGLAADAAKCAGGAIHAAGHEGLGASKGGLAFVELNSFERGHGSIALRGCFVFLYGLISARAVGAISL